jgi:WhiB family redox-sensing transcriptional regulator
MTTMRESFTKSASDQLLSQETTRELRFTSEDWKLDGVCRTIDPDLWFPDAPQTGAVAKRVCRSCPVIKECLQYALDNNEMYGVWGGMGNSERKSLRRRMNIRAI